VLGKMPTKSQRRLTSLLRRSREFVDQIWPHQITRRLSFNLPLSEALRSAGSNAEVGGSSPPRPTSRAV
jgi:hypothetical protein